MYPKTRDKSEPARWRYAPPVEVKQEHTKSKGTKTPLTYEKMVVRAIKENKSRKGTDILSVYSYIYANYKVGDNYTQYASKALQRLADEGKLNKLSSRRYSLTTKATKPSKAIKAKKPKTRGEKAVSKAKKVAKNAEVTKTKEVGKGKGSKKMDEKPVEKAPKEKPQRKAAAKTQRAKKTPEKTKTKVRKASPKKATPKEVTKATRTKAAPKETKAHPIKTRGKAKLPAAQANEAPAPAQPSLIRQPSSRLEVAKSIQRPQVDTKLEIVFAFDTTGSILDNVREKIGDIVGNLFKDIKGIRIGVIAFGDYTQTKEEPYVIKIRDFSTDIDEIVSFVYGVEQTYGGDWEEAYEYALKKARTKVSWTEGYSRALVIIGKTNPTQSQTPSGDAIPHPKDQYKKIDWEEELDLLVKDEVKIYGVQCRTVNEDVTKFFQTLTSKSGGTAINLTQIDSLSEIIYGLCYREATEVQFQVHEKEITERISRLERAGSAQLIMPEGDDREELPISDAELLEIHNAIHDTSATSVTIAGETYEIAVGAAGCRFVKVGERTFIEQNKEKDTKYARMAMSGQAITWVCRAGRWGLIIDQNIVRR